MSSLEQQFSPELLPDGFQKLSVVLPCYRIGEKLEENLMLLTELLAPIPYELIPVDDGSGDDSPQVLRKLEASLGSDKLKPVLLPENQGKGAALQAGFTHCSGSHVLLLDGDLDLSPTLLWQFFKIMRLQRSDVVIGSKLHPDSVLQYPLRRRIASFVYYSIVKLLLRLPIHDTQTGMKLFTREALKHAFDRMLSKRFAFDLEVLAILNDAGYSIAEAPVKLDFGNKMGALTVHNTLEVMQDTLAIFYRTRILKYYRKQNPTPPQLDESDRRFVSVVIACPHASSLLEQCIQGLCEQSYTNFEAIILPDTPSGKAWPPFVREIPTGKVRPAEKRNRGIQEAKGEIIAFLDDDAFPSPTWLAHALPHFRCESVGGVGGPAVTPADEPLLATLSGEVYASPLVAGGYRRRYIPTSSCLEDDLPSCNLIIRRDSLLALNGFDIQFWPGEDTILCMRLVKELGLKLLYDPAVLVSHHRRPLFAPHLRQVARYSRHRGYFSKRFPATSRRLSYFIPSLFLLGTLGLLSLLLLQCVYPHPVIHILNVIGLTILAIYFSAALLFSLPASFVKPPQTFGLRPLLGWICSAPIRILLVFFGIASTHYAYGLCFLRGLFGRSLARPSSTVKPFDHQGK